ncbi:hypothetical protein EMCRGX_G025504 [Ephydatia muelleri]
MCDAQSFKCDNFLSKPLCPGTVAQCSCVITVNTSYIRWNFTNLDVCPSSENLISLSQVCADNITGSCGPYLHAAIIPSGSNLCNTSILTIKADTSLDGLIIECRDPNTAIYPGALVGSVNVTIAAAPGPLEKINGSVGADWIMVSWTPPTIVPLQNYTYNVSYSNGSHTSSPVVIADNGSSVYHHNFTGLISDTLYTVSVVAVNCAGSSNVETLSNRTPVPATAPTAVPATVSTAVPANVPTAVPAQLSLLLFLQLSLLLFLQLSLLLFLQLSLLLFIQLSCYCSN